MFSPVTVVKVRKATKVTVPAGGWILLGHPEQPLADQIARRNELIQAGNVSDEFERLIIGRITDSHTPTHFITSDQKKSQGQQQATTEKDLAQSHADAVQRQKDRAAALKKKEQAAHEAQVAELNTQNDATRQRDLTGKPALPPVQLETISPKKSKPEETE